MTTNLNSTTATTKTESTQEIAHKHENHILYWINRFGYLTAPQVAAIAYQGCTQAERLARRTLARLAKYGYVICNKGHIGAFNHFSISLNGAKRLFDLYEIKAVSGKNLIRKPSSHRDAANWAAIKMLDQGWKVYTEREIQTEVAPFKIMSDKVPDLLGYDEDGFTVWGEVEASRRGGRDMEKLVDWLVNNAFPPNTDHIVFLDPPQETLYLERVRFILASPLVKTFPERLRTALNKKLMRHDMNAYSFALNRIEFQFGIAIDALVRIGYDDGYIDGLLKQTPYAC